MSINGKSRASGDGGSRLAGWLGRNKNTPSVNRKQAEHSETPPCNCEKCEQASRDAAVRRALVLGRLAAIDGPPSVLNTWNANTNREAMS